MIGLYKDPEGETIFTGGTSTTLGSTTLVASKDSNGEGGLQRRIRELEDEKEVM